MRRTVSRSQDGRIQGGIAYWLNSHEEENYKDHKIKADKIMFPQHKGSMHGEVITYKLSDLK
jgi:hypothetical protein